MKKRMEPNCSICKWVKSTPAFPECTAQGGILASIVHGNQKCQKAFKPIEIQKDWDGEHCQICGRGYETCYIVPNQIWSRITPKSGEAGLLCIECADKRAREQGIILYWEASKNDFPSAGKKITNKEIRWLKKQMNIFAKNPTKTKPMSFDEAREEYASIAKRRGS